jgi:hypothetical protein
MALLPPQARLLASALNKTQRSVSGGQFTGVKPSFMLYLGLFFIAFLKDLLDFVGLGSLPGVGTVVTLCFSFLIWMLMTLFDRSGGKSNNKMARGLVLFFLTMIEGVLFGLNFLPIESLTVIALYMMARSAAKKEEKRLGEEEAARNRANQIASYRLQTQMIAQAQMVQEAATVEADQHSSPKMV